MPKGAKGNITIDSNRGWLRLRFRVYGKSYAMALGLPDSAINRKVAQDKANQIELDIISNNFDPTLAKYRPPKVGLDYREGRLTYQPCLKISSSTRLSTSLLRP